MGCGKSHVAKALRDGNLFDLASIVSYSTPLKSMLRAGFPMVPEAAFFGTLQDKHYPQDMFCGRSARYVMQKLGTEWGRDLVHPDIWLKNWAHHAEHRIRQGISVIADDVRFENEVVQITKTGGQLFYLAGRGDVQPKQPWWRFFQSLCHPSERPLNLCKNVVTIDNSEGRTTSEVVADITQHLKPLSEEIE